MLKKIFFVFSLLTCICGESLAEDYDFTKGPKPSWYDEVCGPENYDFDKCLRRLIGMHKILEWNDAYFADNGETTTTMISLEARGVAGHAGSQKRVIKASIAGEVNQYFGTNKEFPYSKLFPGAIATRANLVNFFETNTTETSIDFSKIQSVVVTGTGNSNTIGAYFSIGGFNDELSQLPFPIIFGGFDFFGWKYYCNDDSGNCAIFRTGKDFYYGGRVGSNACGGKARNHCLLGIYSWPVQGGVISGTSIATGHGGGVIWAVAYFLKHKYEWSEPMTQLQAAVTSVAIVKSCAKDIGPPGPDYEHGLGYLNLDCLNDDSDDGFVENPLSVIKDELYLVPDASYIKPKLAGSQIEVQLKVYPEGLLN